MENQVQILKANNGPEVCHVLAGHCLEGFLVRETRGTAWTETKEGGQPVNQIASQEPRGQNIFSNSTPGCIDQVELNLELKPGTQLIRQRFQDLIQPWRRNCRRRLRPG